MQIHASEQKQILQEAGLRRATTSLSASLVALFKKINEHLVDLRRFLGKENVSAFRKLQQFRARYRSRDKARVTWIDKRIFGSGHYQSRMSYLTQPVRGIVLHHRAELQ